MKLTLRRKIIATNLIVLLLTFLVVSIVVVEGLNATNKHMLINNLIHQADISVISIKQTLFTGDLSTSKENEFIARGMDFASKLSQETNMRVLIFSKSKMLIADSTNENLQFPFFKELDKVIEGNRTYVIRDYNGERYLFFAFPVLQVDKLIGEVMFVYPMNEMDKNVKNIRFLLLLAFIIGTIIIFIVSILLSSKITKPLQQLKESAIQIAGGKFQNKININSSDEIGELARSFNTMSCEIENRINIINLEKGKLGSILESMGEGVVALDSSNEIITVNSRASSIINNDVKHEMQKIALKVKEQQSRIVVEINSSGKNLMICGTPLNLDKSETGIVFVINDVTELRLLQEKQRQFVTNVSHELKTPLTTIIGYVDLLAAKGHDTDVFDTSIHYLKSASNRLLRLVNDLIDLSCLSKFEFEIEPVSTNLSSLLTDIVGQMSLKAQKFNIKIKTKIPQISDVMLDPLRIKQAVVNILDNAIKYSTGGEIEINLSDNGSNISLEIKDTGCGIPSEVMDKIFEPFYRVDKARSRNLGGNGLGLSITKEIIEKHNGKIAIESSEDKGTKVIIILPG